MGRTPGSASSRGARCSVRVSSSRSSSRSRRSCSGMSRCWQRADELAARSGSAPPARRDAAGGPTRSSQSGRSSPPGGPRAPESQVVAAASAAVAGRAAVRRPGRRDASTSSFSSRSAASPGARTDPGAVRARRPWQPRARRSAVRHFAARPPRRAARRAMRLRWHPHQRLRLAASSRPARALPSRALPTILNRPTTFAPDRARPTRRQARSASQRSAPRQRARPHRQQPPSATASCTSTPITIIGASPPYRWGRPASGQTSLDGESHAPIRSRSTVSGRRRRHNAGKSALGRRSGIESAAADPSLVHTPDATLTRQSPQ